MPFSQLVLASLVLAGSGCDSQPDLLCDRARVVWPFAEIVPADEIDPDQLVEVDIPLRTSLLPGTRGYLAVQGQDWEEPVAHPQIATVQDDGDLEFFAVTLPVGRVRLSLAVENECGPRSTSRLVYVWDGRGFPRCDLDMTSGDDVASFAPLRVLRSEHDQDDQAEGLQISATVTAGRPDMDIDLFILDVDSGTETVVSQASDQNGQATFDFTLPAGEQSVRALCTWPVEDLVPSSETRQYFVDAVAPTCELTEPTSAITSGDDIDDDMDGVQFVIAGFSADADVVGQPARFVVDDVEFDGGSVDQTGSATAQATVMVSEPAEPQTMEFFTTDAAGNGCQAVITF